jgi:NAD(P)-dependent dehydrogenase (short-subunit alcohol dehydrogenase family)
MMKILMIGGTGTISSAITRQLAASGHELWLLNRGTRIEQAEERGMTKETSDWMQGYGYQMWRCRPGCFRADGARGQYIIVVPDKNAVIAITSDNGDLQGELDLVWERILPVL